MRILIKGSLRILAVLTLATVPAPAVLVSSGNLGTFALGGSVNIIEDPGANNADWYPGVVSFLDWRNKLVCEFQASETLRAQVTSKPLTGDPDFFLLSNLNPAPFFVRGSEAGGTGAGEVVCISFGIASEPSTIVLFALLPCRRA